MKKTKNWKDMKKWMLKAQSELEEVNGSDYCKNCGINFKDLIKDIEEIFPTN